MRTMILAAALVAFATPALADTSWTATPVHASTQTGFVGDSAVWDCTAAGCSTSSDTSEASAMAECRSLAQQIGTLSAFVPGKETFTAAQLAHCNEAAAKN
jgi:hypothetical protein